MYRSNCVTEQVNSLSDARLSNHSRRQSWSVVSLCGGQSRCAAVGGDNVSFISEATYT